uniref:SAM domain-containing protein n=1 Tax=Timema cristinae TaxID=61476 RepID=A0A7R9CJZ5_TIMCR|nr:unnamed protein product [Timema cristinae]
MEVSLNVRACRSSLVLSGEEERRALDTASGEPLTSFQLNAYFVVKCISDSLNNLDFSFVRRDGTVDSMVDSMVDGTVNDTLDGTVDSMTYGTMDVTVDGTVNSMVYGTVVVTVTGTVNGTVDGVVDDTADSVVDDAADGTVDVNDTLDGTVDSMTYGTMDVTVDGTVNSMVYGTVVVTVTGTVNGTVDGVVDDTADSVVDDAADGTVDGLDNAVLVYIHSFLNNEVNGQQLLNLRPDDLNHLGVHKLGHQELILEAVEHLRNFHDLISLSSVAAIQSKTRLRSQYDQTWRSLDPSQGAIKTASNHPSPQLDKDWDWNGAPEGLRNSAGQGTPMLESRMDQQWGRPVESTSQRQHLTANCKKPRFDNNHFG